MIVLAYALGFGAFGALIGILETRSRKRTDAILEAEAEVARRMEVAAEKGLEAARVLQPVVGGPMKKTAGP